MRHGTAATVVIKPEHVILAQTSSAEHAIENDINSEGHSRFAKNNNLNLTDRTPFHLADAAPSMISQLVDSQAMRERSSQHNLLNTMAANTDYSSLQHMEADKSVSGVRSNN